MKVLNVYGQPAHHMDVIIAGNKEGLLELKRVIEEAIEHGTPHKTSGGSDTLWSSDGEGYQLEARILPDDWLDDAWKQYLPFYHFVLDGREYGGE